MHFSKSILYASIVMAFTASNAYAITDPNIEGDNHYFTSTQDKDTSEVILTGGKNYNFSNTIFGGGHNTKHNTSSLTITGEKGKTVFNNEAAVNPGSFYEAASRSKTPIVQDKATLIMKDVEAPNGLLVYGATRINAGYNEQNPLNVTVKNSDIHLTDVTGVTNLYASGRIYYSNNTTLRVDTTKVLFDGKSTANNIYGGALISGSASIIDSKVSVGNVNITLGKDTVVNNKVVAGHFVNYFGHAEVTGDASVTVDGGKVKGKVIGGSLANWLEDGEHNGGDFGLEVEASERKIVSGSGTTSNIIVRNGSEVGDVIGGSFIERKNQFNPTLKFTATSANTNIQIEDSIVTGNVVGGGLIFDEANTSSVDVTESVKINIVNSTVEGIITTDSLNVTETEAKTVGTSVKAENVSLNLTNVNTSMVHASKGRVGLRAIGDGKTTVDTLVTEGAYVEMTTDGDANDAANGDITQAIVITDGKYVADRVVMDEGMQQGAVEGYIGTDGKVHTTQQTNSILSNTVDIYAGSTLALNRIMMSDLRKRMGDLRATEEVNGVWARYNGGKFSGARGLENQFNTIEVGADTAALVDGVRLGVALSYTDSESDMLRGKADMDAFSLAAYGTKFFDNGIYADVIGRFAKADTDVSVDGNKNGKMDNLAVSLSGELGWRFDLSKQIYIEPQTELTYTNIDSDTLKLSSGHEYKFDSVDSLIGRVGVATGIKCPNNKGDVYVRVSAVHEFLGDAKVTSGRVTHEVKGDDTWMEYGLGANFNINKNAYVYTELERSAGAALEEDWRANLGVRIAF